MTAPVCTAEDRRRWRRLVVEARACAANPDRSAEELRRAADKAVKAVFPDQAADKREPFRKLIGFAQLWPAMDRANRKGNAEAVHRLCDVCADVLGLEAPPPPASAAAEPWRGMGPSTVHAASQRRYRADLDG